MVFAVWSGRARFLTDAVSSAFRASYDWGREHVDEMVDLAAAERGFPRQLARAYFTRHIVYELSARHLEGLALFRRLVRDLDSSDGVILRNPSCVAPQ
jgi:predicted solute-binding protein